MKLSLAASLAPLGACLLLAAACKRTEAPAPTTQPQASSQPAAVPASDAEPAPAAPPQARRIIKRPPETQRDWRALLEQLGPPSLLTLRENEGRCEWSVLRPPQLEERLFMVTHVCPTELVWNRSGGKSLFTLEGILYLHDWADARVTELTTPPVAQPALGFSVTGTPRVCGEESPSDADDAATFAAAYDLQADGSWQQIGYEPIAEDAVPEPCSGPLDAPMTGEMRYNPRYQPASTCAIGNRPADAVCPNRQLLDEMSKQVKDHDAIEYIGFSAQSFIAYPIDFGEELARLAPVFAIENGVITQIYDRQPAVKQWEVLLGADYFLVRGELDMTHATLFKKGATEPAKEFADEVRVFWIPGTLPAADVIRVTPQGSGDDEAD